MADDGADGCNLLGGESLLSCCGCLGSLHPLCPCARTYKPGGLLRVIRVRDNIISDGNTESALDTPSDGGCPALGAVPSNSNMAYPNKLLLLRIAWAQKLCRSTSGRNRHSESGPLDGCRSVDMRQGGTPATGDGSLQTFHRARCAESGGERSRDHHAVVEFAPAAPTIC